MKKILVSGATGFVGGAVLRRLCSEDFCVTAALRCKTVSLPLSVTQCLVDNLDSNTKWSEALRGQEVVIHCAARVHVMNDTAEDKLKAFRAINVEGTLNLARQATAAGVRRFVFLSSIGVNGARTAPGMPFSEADHPSPHNAYTISKWEAEQSLLSIAHETGLEVVIIRPPLVYGRNAPGNFGYLVRAVQRGWPLPLGAVHNKRSLVALDNLVDFIITCITHPQAANQTFLISDGHDISTTQLVQGLTQAAGLPNRLLQVPTWALLVGASLLGKGDVINSLCGNLQVDISAARSLLGWVPPISVEEGFRRSLKV